MPIKFLVLGGGIFVYIFFFFWGGGVCRLYFSGREVFSDIYRCLYRKDILCLFGTCFGHYSTIIVGMGLLSDIA